MTTLGSSTDSELTELDHVGLLIKAGDNVDHGAIPASLELWVGRMQCQRSFPHPASGTEFLMWLMPVLMLHCKGRDKVLSELGPGLIACKFP